MLKIGQKLHHVGLDALADMVRSDHLRFRVNGYKHPLTAELRRVARSNAPLVLLDIRPDLFTLQIPGIESADFTSLIRAALFQRPAASA